MMEGFVEGGGKGEGASKDAEKGRKTDYTKRLNEQMEGERIKEGS